MVSMDGFDNHELILVNPSSPDSGVEDEVINNYLQNFSNIQYIKINRPLPLYETWNTAIRYSSGDYISNANPDDRKLANFISTFLKNIQDNPTIDVFYADSLIAFNELELKFPKSCRYRCKMPDCSPANLIVYNPLFQAPVWKKQLHERNGFFSDDFDFAGDHDFWLRCLQNQATFQKINEICGVYFFNPDGLSTNTAKKQQYANEVKEKYAKIFGYTGPIHGRLEDIYFPA
jgi:hypothetical protein